ncbi:MAG: hypothetical protein GY765_03730, partial [bacterium]|nr:hypothetical protein [bacterium]
KSYRIEYEETCKLESSYLNFNEAKERAYDLFGFEITKEGNKDEEKRQK